MVDICDLCTELVQEGIGLHVSTTELRALRATCRHIRWAIDPLFCAATTLVLDVNKYRPNIPSQLETLAAGPTAWSYCQCLKISSLAPLNGEEGTLNYESMHMLLRPALESLGSLSYVHWSVNQADPEWAQRTVVEVLNTREHFAQLKLVNGMSAGDRFEALPPISRIRILTVEAPPELWTGGFLAWMKQVVRASPHLECIPFLSMDGCAQMCEILEQEKVRLKDVSILSPHPAFLHYLASYSGLERLEIADVFPDAHGQMLWERVVPKHKASLVVLICPGVSEGLCSFGEHNVKVISQLRKLEMLEISVNSSEMAPKVGKGERDVVELFLEMAAEMPSLQNIAILSTLGRWVGGCGNAMERDFDYSQKRIGEILEAFGRARGSPALTSLIETHWRRIKGIDGRIKGINGWARLFNTKPMYGSLKYEY